jgi:hypothetical protein
MVGIGGGIAKLSVVSAWSLQRYTKATRDSGEITTTQSLSTLGSDPLQAQQTCNV